MAPIQKVNLIFFLITLSTTADAEKFVFSAIDKLPDQAVGIIVITEIYRQIGHDLNVLLMPGLRAQQSANSGAVNGEVMRIFAYGEQTPNVVRVPTSFYSVKTVAYKLKGNDINVQTKEDLIHYKSVIVRGVRHTEKITRAIDRQNVHFTDSPEAMMRFIQAGRAQLALTNPLEGMLLVKNFGFTDLELIGPTLAYEPLYHYVHKDHVELVPLINQKLQELKASGELDILVRKSEAEVISNWSNKIKPVKVQD